MLSRRTSVALSVLLWVGVWAPAAPAAVPRVGDTFSPRNGEELAEAVTLAAALPAPQSPDDRARIELAAQTYAISGTLELHSARAITLEGPAQGTAVISNAAGTSPRTLIRAWGNSNGWRATVSGVHIEAKGTSTGAFSVAEGLNGSDWHDLAVIVPAGTPSGTGLRLAPAQKLFAFNTSAGVNAWDVAVTSAAPSAPALTAGIGSTVSRFDIDGGNPSVRFAEDGPVLQEGHVVPFFGASFTVGTVSGLAWTDALVEVAPSSGRLVVDIRSAVLDGHGQSERLLHVRGATSSSGSAAVTLSGATALGAVASTAVAIDGGLETTASTVELPGLLSLGSATTLGCSAASGAAPQARLNGVFREGALASGSCEVNERGRRTGDPKFRDRASGDLEPLWGSSLIDGAPLGTGGAEDLLRRRRPSSNPYHFTEDPADIGALEYQHTGPTIDDWIWGAFGNRGLVAFLAEASDSSQAEDAAYGVTYQWRFGDGATAEGPEVEHRFPADPDTHWAELSVRDVTGYLVTEYIPVEAWVALCEQATDAADYSPADPCPEPGTQTNPPPRTAPFVAPTTPNRSTMPPRVLPTPKVKVVKPPAPVLAAVTVVRARASLRSRRATSLSSTARSTEAAVRVRLRVPATVTMSVARKRGGAFVPVPASTLTETAVAGWRTLRITSHFGKAKLKPGLHQVTVTVAPTDGRSAEVRRFNVRVTGR